MTIMTVAVKVITKMMMIHMTAVIKVHSAPLQPTKSEKIYMFTMTTGLTNNLSKDREHMFIIQPIMPFS